MAKLISHERIQQIKAHFCWTAEEKDELLDHIAALEAMVDPKVLKGKYLQQEIDNMQAELQQLAEVR